MSIGQVLVGEICKLHALFNVTHVTFVISQSSNSCSLNSPGFADQHIYSRRSMYRRYILIVNRSSSERPKSSLQSTKTERQKVLLIGRRGCGCDLRATSSSKLLKLSGHSPTTCRTAVKPTEVAHLQYTSLAGRLPLSSCPRHISLALLYY